MLSNGKNGTLYIGVTNNLLKRVKEHKEKILLGFTSKYNVTDLVYYEQTENVHSAISKEKVLKKWERQWKINLIEKENPEWIDLYFELGGV